jgi:c-di-GMP-binding flagellar brake protein YcgR
MSDFQFFVPIDAIELKDVLDFLTSRNTEVNVKIGSAHAKTNFVPSQRKNLTVINKFQNKFSPQQIICNFDLKGDQFFFKSQCQSEEHAIFIDIPTKIFKLQRRNNFRVNIPLTMPQAVQIKEKLHMKAICRNISLGGALISLSASKSDDFKLNDIIHVSISLYDFQEKNIESMVRFVDYKEHSQTVLMGIQFLELDSDQSSLLQSTLVRIDRFLRGKDDI